MNVTTVTIQGCHSQMRYTSTLFQYDYGQILKIEGVELPDTFQAHFCNVSDTSTKTVLGSDNQVSIPDEYLDTGEDILCYIYLHTGEDDGETEYKIFIPVTARQSITNEEPTPEQQSEIDQLIIALNDGVSRAETAATNAETSETNAKTSEDNAKESELNAKASEDAVEAFAVRAESAATSAEASASSASQSATSASASATLSESWAVGGTGTRQGEDTNNAKYYAESTIAAKDEAVLAKTQAESARDLAVQAKDSAQASEQTATQKASEATQSAANASQSASSASASSTSASQSSALATSAKEAAETAQGLAENAKDEAVTAKEEAETAQQEAEEAAASVSASASQIAQNTEDISDLKSAVLSLENITTTSETVDEPVTLDIQNGYYQANGTYVAENGRGSAIVEPVSTGEKYKITCSLGSTLIYGVLFIKNGVVTSKIMQGTGTPTDYVDYEFTIPDDCDSMIVQTAYVNRVQVSLKKVITQHVFKAYTKPETDNLISNVPKKYGVKWEISNPDDLGQRCFNAVGLSATIGIGSTNGSSDFDTIYPWSEMKRCNIKQNSNGAKIITYEGEDGFSLDGSNGDVFVRIPKFYYERYRADGYEYRVVSAVGTNVHPAFVESGKILDEIFVGAFEGNIVDTKLHSVGGVIPTANETGQTFLDSAEANGNGFTLYDMRAVDAIWTLLAVEYGCRNTNQIFGYGWADFFQPISGTYGVNCDTAGTTNVFSASKSISSARIAYMPVGSNCTICKGSQINVIAVRKITAITSDTDHWYITFDGDPVELDTTCFIGSAGCTTNFCETAPSGALSWHTGRANWISGSNTRNPVRYRWVENLVGSLWHLLPDVTFNNLQMYACDDITKYSVGAISDGYTAIGDLLTEQSNNGAKADIVGQNYWVTDLNNFSFGKGYDFGKTWDTSLLSTKAFGAYYYLQTGLKYIANGGGFDHLYRCNMLTNRAWIDVSQKWYLYGARLQYKNI